MSNSLPMVGGDPGCRPGDETSDLFSASRPWAGIPGQRLCRRPFTLKRLHRLFLCLVVAVLVFIPVNGKAQKTHTVFYEGSDNELHVYRVYGEKPGKTLLLIGGIQGNEPGGVLAADLYADFSLEKGNLIVVPRANFPSILHKRRKINQDMNRKFADDSVANYEAKVVKVLKQLIRESDCLLNLHEGSGFYSPKDRGPLRNPSRFGQSIIADAGYFQGQSGRVTLDLKTMAETVIKKINTRIVDPDHYFHFNNHKTEARDSSHKEQRKSATYFALYTCSIPAFGIESAKSLPLEQKVRQHIYAINAFMEMFDIVPETPGVDLTPPRLEYMVLSVNGSVPVVVENGQHLGLEPGDSVVLMDIKANYTRGLSADIIGFGSRFSDMGNPVTITRPTRVVAKKDFYPCGSIYLDFGTKGEQQEEDLSVSESDSSPEIKAYRLRINDRQVTAKSNDHLSLSFGDSLVIEDIVTGGVDPSKYTVNFKGFVGNRATNSGEDRGFVIKMSRNVLMKRYSLNGQGRHYRIVTTLEEKEVSRLYIDIEKQRP
ncbi:MAG: M14/M99 family metallopeptidase [Desulfobacteraceae bacterium]